MYILRVYMYTVIYVVSTIHLEACIDHASHSWYVSVQRAGHRQLRLCVA